MGDQRSTNRNFPLSDSDSVHHLKGGSTVWRDNNFTPLSLSLGASAPDKVKYNGTSIDVLAFDGNATIEEVHGGTEYNHEAKEGSDIVLHLHWSPTTNNAGNVKWQCAYVWAPIDSPGLSETVISVTQAASGTAWEHHKVSFPPISGVGKKVGSQIGFRFFRDPTDAADTYPNDAAITFTIGFHYEIDTLGSRQTLTK